MNALKILIVEDNLIQAQELEEQLLDFGYAITDNVSNGTDALIAFRRRLPDLVICDIGLDDSNKDGIELVKAFNKIVKVPIIFLTAFGDTKTLERAKAVNPAYYLIKPCNQMQLQVAIDFALDNFTHRKEAAIDHSLSFHTETTSSIFSNNHFFFVKDKDKYCRVTINDILWVEADGSYVKIVTEEEILTATMNLSSFLKQITTQLLIRIHRSYAVNFQKVTSFDKDSLYLLYKGKSKQFSVGRTYRDTFSKKLPHLKSD